MKALIKIIYECIVLLFIAELFNSCTYINNLFDSDENDIIVSIGDNKLYRDDLKDLVPEGTNSADSTMIINGYITRWATNILLFENAKRNVDNSDEIDELVENYRKTLIIHYYQQNMVNENIKMPTDIEAIAFYNKNKELFKLTEPAVKGAIICVPNDIDISQFKKDFKNLKKEINSVENFAVSYATKYLLFNEQWQDVNTIKEEINMPISINGRGFYELNDSNKTIFINILDYIKAGDIAPQELVLDKARQELYNQKKMDYIRNFGKHIYDYALRHDQIKFYDLDSLK